MFCISLLQGTADPLNSAFHLTYNMVLNLLRVEEVNPEIMLEKSFYQFQNYASVPGMIDSKYILRLFQNYFPCTISLYCFHCLHSISILLSELKELEAKRDTFEIPNEESITAYYKIRQQLKKLGNDMLVSIWY